MTSLLNRDSAPTDAELADADELGRQLVRLLRLLTRAKAQVARQDPDGIERAAYAILGTLICEGPQRTSKLAESLYSEISTVSRQSSALVQHGLVERQADPEDGRACLLAATPEGRRVFEQNRQQRNLWIAGALADWPQEERAALTVLFERFNTAIETHSPQHAAADTTAARGDKE
ncbi:MarR family transcriptional regulator [Amycolatopsis antarctica]|uniref:MarR family transcriptional regulator n=1 Tax=Amycolatopsis antarctica TaxID=1854586 RepID=A0A263CZ18_9PSEU|nr:MarR family transcriptional regulator [Amycolatopsis antarctica]OZM71414.1 MarR family transcriptional regulator [Amycolatopsis antarctica]